MTNNTKILSLDLGTKTGWAVTSSKGVVLESGVQDFSKKRGDSNGMLFIRFRKWLCDMLAMVKPSIVVYELAHHRGGYAVNVAVNLQGRVEEECEVIKCEYAGVHTATLKKFSTGNGRAGKDEMKEVATRHKGKPVRDDNEADAICIGQLALMEFAE